MTAEMMYVAVIFAVSIAVFVWDKIRMDLVALGVVLALMLSQVLTPTEALAGFGHPVVVMVAALFVVGEGIVRTGLAAELGNLLFRWGKGEEGRILLVMLPMVALLSTSMSSTGTVALMMPVVLSMAKKANIHAGRLLMPMGMVTLIAGTTTLIGTPPNIVVSEALKEAGRAGFGFFDFTPIGGVILLASMVFLLTLGRRWLPNKALCAPTTERECLRDFEQRYQVGEMMHKLVMTPDCAWIGRTVLELRLRKRFGVTVFAIRRGSSLLPSVVPVLMNTTIETGDVLWVFAQHNDLEKLCVEEKVQCLEHSFLERGRMRRQFGYVEVLIPPRSPWLGMTLEEVAFRRRHGLNVLAMMRGHQLYAINYSQTQLHAHDTLLLAGAWSHIKALSHAHGLVVLQTPVEMEEVAMNRDYAPFALLILLGMILMMAFSSWSTVSVALLAALLMIAARCVSVKEAYGALHASSLVVIAGLLPLATAMEKTGMVAYLVQHTLSALPTLTPLMVLILLFGLTCTLGLFISNTATAILLAPVGMYLAKQLGISPEPLMMTIAIAASLSFATPVATPVNMLIAGAGEYQFGDFVRIGVALQLLGLLICVLLIPKFFPF